MHPARVMSTAEKEGKRKKKKRFPLLLFLLLLLLLLTLGMGGNMPIRELYHANRRGKLRPL